MVAIVELSYGILQHLIAYGSDSHVGLPRLLRNYGELNLAKNFERLDTLRQGRWYGGRGNGEIVKECLDLIKEVKKWIES